MEELQDAIEDAQYVNAIATQEEGPRPVLAWEIPDEDSDEPECLSIHWCLQSAIGFFLFSSYLKEQCDDYLRINFAEEVVRWKKLRGKHRVERAKKIMEVYLKELPTDEVTGEQVYPEKTQIDEFDLTREFPKLGMSKEEFEKFCSLHIDPAKARNCLGVCGPSLDEIFLTIKGVDKAVAVQRRSTPSIRNPMEDVPQESGNAEDSSTFHLRQQKEKFSSLKQLTQSWKEKKDSHLPDALFDKVEAVVIESLRREFWDGFVQSENHKKMKNFLWFQDRDVVPDDFFTMRVLGRGGFGLVIACKKGTSGKLYAMKVMNKKRIKLKKSETLAVNERKALAAVESPFVVNLKYSFHSKDDVFLILDLMTGGDLGYHLHQKGKFPKRECQYYAARIMLGLQAMHDSGYVYRDLKPENCLLAEDGRVKITDLGLATKITPTLHGAAGTRGYWAPEMLRRDKKGKRMNYGHTVDWFSFGCCLAEFISGANPFRSEAALNFGLAAGKETKERAIDHSTLEMQPEFPESLFEDDAADLCRRLLNKNEKSRLGTQGCEEIMAHPWFKNVNWESIISDKKRPPYVPPKDVNAASQSEIGTFAEDKKHQECVIDEKDEKVYVGWDWTNPRAYAAEVIEFLIYERETGEPLLP
eukprot:CAMPEP_0117009122 /NCGR_PEP_ID=MMETSP0472-20121206/8377_1 /TAXON_ID=693140 ORGANISM="Tiarina fusus, Strain LIS" /NCGR_SAMPLE_ID=MMETSP0472 /ASSEMBLY_ACC=CAM_ASM_000603 /LENGTH=640 /DNA_ID=CAMNT_0004711325 /DNA_START=330 /DNA_END=2249 /DNA_ORIENTATION=+